jgi:hypothetical protein
MTQRIAVFFFLRQHKRRPQKATKFPFIISNYLKLILRISILGPGSSVGIATDYGLGRSGDRIPVGARFSARVQTGPGAHPASCTMGTGSFLGVNCCRGVTLTSHPLLVPRSWKSRAVPIPTLWATPGV